jgi:DNA repair protein RadC
MPPPAPAEPSARFLTLAHALADGALGGLALPGCRRPPSRPRRLATPASMPPSAPLAPRAGARDTTACAPVLRQRPPAQRPREKAAASGVHTLADDELVALLLRTGTRSEDVLGLAGRLLREHDGLVGLARRQACELSSVAGLGPAKAAELAAAFELGRRLSRASLRERPSMRQPLTVVRLLAPLMGSLPHEELWCLALDSLSRLIGEPRMVTRGDVDGTDAGPRAFFRCALSVGATSCVAVHNHPSGDPTPSAADRLITERLVQAGRVVDVPLVDHIVLGSAGCWVSLRALHPVAFR